MKPQNKFQAQVVKASATLPKLTAKQVQWGYENGIDHIGHRTDKGVITCTKCGHSWQGAGYLVETLTDCHCPACNTRLKVETTRKRTFSSRYYMTVITAHKGYEVVRTVMLLCSVKVGETPKYDYSEVMQRWLAPDGKYCTFARQRQTMGTCYYDAWIFHSDLELRREQSSKYSQNVFDRIYTGVVYPRLKLIPELRRTGYKKALYGQKPLDLFRTLLADNRIETLLKTGQTALMRLFMDDKSRKIEEYWPSIRIAVRNGYKIKDAGLWCDYIDFLRALGKDLHNAKYVCPANLKAGHDRYLNKLIRQEARQEVEELLKGSVKKEYHYRRTKAPFFGLMFSDDTISVRVIESARELAQEGKAMHHCVGGYYDKDDSLIMSATINGKRIETVEISLSGLKVIQCRGVCNKNTPHHDRIVNLVNSNMNMIQQRLTA